MENMRIQMQEEIMSLRNAIDHERSRLHKSYEENAQLDSEKHRIEDRTTAEINELKK